MTDEEKAIDLMKQVAELEEIPPGINFNPHRAWAKIELKMEQQRASKKANWVIIIMVALAVLMIAIAMVGLFAYEPGKDLDVKQEPKKINYVNVSKPNSTI